MLQLFTPHGGTAFGHRLLQSSRSLKGSVNFTACQSRLAAASTKSDSPNVRLVLDTKVSKSGTPDALFQECIDAVRQQRARLSADSAYRDVETGAITKLKQDELDLTRKIFRRVDPTGNPIIEASVAKHDIDPYWNPFSKVRDLKEQVTAEFDEYARFVSAADQKRIRHQVKKSLRRCSQVYNPYSSEFRRWHGQETGDQPPKPFRLPDKHWELTPLQERLSRERITWRDVDIIQHFIADNGYILPRRTTMLSRRKQAELVKAVQIAQRMALLPYNWKLKSFQAMPLVDPLQWMVDRLTDKVTEERDKRSHAMLRVMMERHPELNFRAFLKHEAEKATSERAASSVH